MTAPSQLIAGTQAAPVVCSRCVMDTSDTGISFDEQGVCSYCRRYDLEVRPRLYSPAFGPEPFERLIDEVRTAGKGKPYDAILGLSGGVDSSYNAYLAWKAGLRVLLVHLDNNWDTELAVKNIENIVRKTGFDYENFIIDWDEFRDLQISYLKASVVDAEVPSDQAIFSLMYRQAEKYGVRFILSGENLANEGSFFGRDWSCPMKFDLSNLLAIHSKFGTLPLRTYPSFGLFRLTYYEEILGIRRIRPLDSVDFGLKMAIGVLEREFGWRYYGGKHYESLFTKFYQGHLLPKKWGLDKRRVHLSALINSGQIERREALGVLETEAYPPDQLATELPYVLKKLGMSESEYQTILATPPVSHFEFPTDTLSLTDWWKLHALNIYHNGVFPKFRRIRLAFKQWILGDRRKSE